MPDVRHLLKLEASGTLTTGIKDRWIAPFAGEIVNMTVVLGTAPTGATLIFDLLKEGVTVFTTAANRPTVPIGAVKSPVSARPDIVTFSSGDSFALSIAQIGSTVAGADADVTVQFILS